MKKQIQKILMLLLPFTLLGFIITIYAIPCMILEYYKPVVIVLPVYASSAKKTILSDKFGVLPTNLDVYEIIDEFQGNVSAYNSVVGQTDSEPCIGAFGYICDKENVVANNYYLKGTKIDINGTIYTVLDRMNKRYGKYDFDIYMGKDVEKAKQFGRQELKIKILKKQ